MVKIIAPIKTHFLITFLFLGFVCTSQTKSDSIKQNFVNAKNEIEGMLNGKSRLDYERTVFITENAYYENKLDYYEFKNIIDLHLENIKIISSQVQKENNVVTKPNILISKDSSNKNIQRVTDNFAIYKYITDTTYFVFDSVGYFHPNFQYSFSDPFATNDWRNSQVTSLLDFEKHYGNCNALTSLYKIFSARLNSNAILCTAPNHIFIRHADENGTFYNIELASKSFPGTGSIETITYTTDEAARSGIAMRELDLKQSIALLLINLAKGYEHKLKNNSDNFILDCAELCLKYDNLNLNAMLLKAEFLNKKIIVLNKTIKQLQTNPDFIAYQKQITELYNLGYREMPIEMKNQLVAALMQDSTYMDLAADKTYNPFVKSYKNNNRSYSLSKGIFEEVNTTKPQQQYYNVVFDTKTKKITGIVNQKPLYNKYDFDPVTFALSIDPLASKYPYLSPYAFVADNPLVFIDPDGRDIVGANGQIAVKISPNGGFEYTTNATPAIKRTVEAMIKTEVGKELVSKMVTEPQKITISITNVTMYTDGKGHSSTFKKEGFDSYQTGLTDPVYDKNGKLVAARILIYEGSIRGVQKTENMSKYTVEEVLGSTAVHEATHATDKDSQSAIAPAGTNTEQKPNENSKKYQDEIDEQNISTED